MNPSFSVLGIFAVLALAGTTPSCSQTATTGTAVNDPLSSADLQITITSPTTAYVCGNSVVLSGAIALTGTKVAVSKVKVSLTSPASSQVVSCAVSGKTYTCPAVDTTVLDAKNKPLFKDNSSAPITVTATLAAQVSGGIDLTASASPNFQVDNLAPVIKLSSPVEGDVAIGQFDIVGTASEKAWGTISTTVGVTGQTPDELMVQAKTDPAPHPLIAKAGSFKATFRPKDQATHPYTLTIHAQDQCGNAADTVVHVNLLRPPTFQGDTWTKSRQLYDKMPDDAPTDMVTVDLDGDGILDAVVGTATGLVVRQGQDTTVNPATGVFLPRFDVPPALDPGKAADVNWKYKRFSGIKVARLLLTNLDGPVGAARDDVLAVGMDNNSKPVAWGLLNISLPGASGAAGTPRLVHADTSALPDDPLSLALVDLNGDGREDMVVGAKTEDRGLTTEIINLAPVCSCGTLSAPCAADFYAQCEAAATTTTFKASVFPTSASGLHSIVQKGVTGITSIAVGDFFVDGANVPDICVGEKDRPRVSCYRNYNKDGSLEQPQDSYDIPDIGAADSHFVLAANWSTLPSSAPDGTDLLVSTHKGLLRWLRNDNKSGTFTFDPKTDMQVVGLDVSDAVVINHGPALAQDTGKKPAPYLYLSTSGRVVTQMPLYATVDLSWAAQCFRSWVMGDGALRLQTGNFDNDSNGLDDIAVLQGVGGGIAVVPGLAGQDFVAPQVRQVCSSLDSGFWGPNEIAAVVSADLTKDATPAPELLIIGKTSLSLQPGLSGACKDPSPPFALHYKPVWTMAVFMNTGKHWDTAPRIGEFAPYYWTGSGDSQQPNKKAGVSTDCPDSPKPLGDVTGAAVGDVDGNGIIDLVVSRDVQYSVGVTAASSAKCPPCTWDERNEYDPFFGVDGPDSGEPPTACCKNFDTTSDKSKANPLKGYGGGAAFDRASVLSYLNSDVKKPFGLDVTDIVSQLPGLQPPKVIDATYATAGGSQPIGIALADFNNDKHLDAATAMKAMGSINDQKGAYMHDRTRILQGDGKGAFKAVDLKGLVIKDDPVSGMPLSPQSVTYMYVDQNPVQIEAQPFCPGDVLPTLFTLNRGKPTNTYSVIQNVSSGINIAVKPEIHAHIADSDVAAMALRQVDGKNCMDMLVAVSTSIGWLAGLGTSSAQFFESKVNLVEGVANNFVDVELMDVNKDGSADLVLLDSKASSVDIYLGDGTGKFVYYPGALIVEEGARKILPVDVDLDGCTDLLIQSQFCTTLLRSTACDS